MLNERPILAHPLGLGRGVALAIGRSSPKKRVVDGVVGLRVDVDRSVRGWNWVGNPPPRSSSDPVTTVPMPRRASSGVSSSSPNFFCPRLTPPGQPDAEAGQFGSGPFGPIRPCRCPLPSTIQKLLAFEQNSRSLRQRYGTSAWSIHKQQYGHLRREECVAA
jgi:hypothetical protein